MIKHLLFTWDVFLAMATIGGIGLVLGIIVVLCLAVVHHEELRELADESRKAKRKLKERQTS